MLEYVLGGGSQYVGHPLNSETSLMFWKIKMDQSTNIIIFIITSVLLYTSTMFPSFWNLSNTGC